MKRFTLTVLLSFIYCTGFCQLDSFRRNIEQDQWIPFRWDAGDLGERHFDKLSIGITGFLGNSRQPFDLQFDTGANISILYGKSLQSLKTNLPEKYNFLPDLSDESKEAFQSFELKMGSRGPTLTKLWVNNGYGQTFSKKEILEGDTLHIGTWGGDLYADKVLVMDFPKQRIALLNTLSEELYKQVEFVPILVKNNRPHIPVVINDSTYYLMYDSGASLFPLITVKKHWDVINPVAITDTLKNVSTFGKYSDVYGAPMQSDIHMGNRILKPQTIYYHPDPYHHHEPLFDRAGVIGTFGNAYFFDDIIVIDFKNKTFGLVKE